jgi:DHA2 family multidrug resistance protein
VQHLTKYFTAQGSSPAEASGQAIGLIGQLVNTQATILAYIDVFHVCAIVAALMIPLVLILVRRVQTQAHAAVGH